MFVFTNLKLWHAVGDLPRTWWYDAGDDLPSQVLHQGYFKHSRLGVNDEIRVVCHAGTVHMTIVVKSLEPAIVGVLGRHPGTPVQARAAKQAKRAQEATP